MRTKILTRFACIVDHNRVLTRIYKAKEETSAVDGLRIIYEHRTTALKIQKALEALIWTFLSVISHSVAHLLFRYYAEFHIA